MKQPENQKTPYRKFSGWSKEEQEDWTRRDIGFGKEVDAALQAMTEAVKKYNVNDPKRDILIAWDEASNRFMMNLNFHYLERASDNNSGFLRPESSQTT